MANEGFDAGEAPTRRGRKDPALQRRLIEDDPLEDAGDTDDNGGTVYEGLSPGAMIVSKYTREIPVGNDGERVWATYGATDHILPGETADGAFERLVGHTVQGIHSSTQAVVDLVKEEAEERRQQYRNTRIVPARSSSGD